MQGFLRNILDEEYHTKVSQRGMLFIAILSSEVIDLVRGVSIPWSPYLNMGIVVALEIIMDIGELAAIIWNLYVAFFRFIAVLGICSKIYKTSQKISTFIVSSCKNVNIQKPRWIHQKTYMLYTSNTHHYSKAYYSFYD